MAACDRGCFSCPFPDCIMDDVTPEERKASNRLDVTARAEAARAAGADKAAKERERARIKYYKYHEKYSALKKAWRESHREEIRAYERAYYAKNREEILARQREYARRKREEMRGDT